MTDQSSSSAPLWAEKPDYPADLFRGTARYYADYRPAYPDNMLSDLLDRADVAADGVLLDLACGTGEVALALRDHFRAVVAVDQEPEMIEVGKEKAAQLGAANLRWSVGRAEHLQIDRSSLELITVGNAFHRLDRRKVASQAMSTLQPGRCLAVLGSSSLRSGTAPWLRQVVDFVDSWTKSVTVPPAARAHTGEPAPVKLTHEQVLTEAGFREVREYPFPTPWSWTVDEYVGYVHSTSMMADVGDQEQRAKFAAELRHLLYPIAGDATLEETIDFYYILAKRP